MLFPTLTFHVFFLVVFAANWVLRKAGEWRLILLLVASWIFYGAWDWRFVALIQASALLNWGAARLILALPGSGQRKACVTLGVILNLVILGFFKYFDFFAEQLTILLDMAGWERDIPILGIILPVGVSFFTFQGMSYLIDVYHGKSKPAGLLELNVLMSFFPHLVAGPIVRPSHILPQLRERPKLTRQVAATSLILIIWGVVKKAVIANELSVNLVDPVFASPSTHSTLELVVAAYGYAVQIYCDFSAYSDMAIGLAGLLGFRFPRNFNQPYRAASLQDFWRRWHISLSTWLRDYLYITAFGGSRQGLARTCLALFLTMVLGGLWHGASWNFVIWGTIHGAILVVERVWKSIKPEALGSLPNWMGTLLTFHIVTVAWIFFRCKEFATAQEYLTHITAGGTEPGLATPWMAGLILIGMLCHFGPADAIQRLARRAAALPAPLVALFGVLVLLLVEGLLGDGVAPFIYFQF
ncbi:MAG: MBOAT family O-acyltransferase [Chakrabartia sp.]